MLKLTFAFFLALTTPALAAECIHVDAKTEATLSGTLSFSIFAGPAYEDVTKGDIPEPTYILELDEPQCFTGDDDLAAEGKVTYAHLYVAGDDHPELWQQLRMLIGRHVRASGRQPF